ncbi:TPR repeat-containing protein (fragment) [Magnetospirillum sp. LM-5]|uniref:O-linked N-acetylglucosamine transferase family protein n=1 Tax=Magnetospirillum sp. LM-5 TaxID=2681466 RepID=UPI00137FEA2F
MDRPHPRQPVELSADPFTAAFNRGLALKSQGRLDEAAAAYRQAIALGPDQPAAYNNLAVILAAQGKTADAIAHYQHVLKLAPDHRSAHGNLGLALKSQGRLAEAVSCYRRALDMDPDDIGVLNNLGAALQELARTDEAIVHLRRAVELAPDHPQALYNLGNALSDAGNLDEAIACYARAVAAKPSFALARGRWAHLMRHACDWSDDGEQEAAVLAQSREADIGISPFGLVATPASLQDIRMCAERWGRQYRQKSVFVHRPPTGSDKIRIGYLSADLHRHATAFLMAELFERHDRARFETHAFSYGPDDGSDMRKRLTRAFDRFIDIRAASPGQAARVIHDFKIDILVDLKGYTQHARPGILAFRPAPVQVNYLGYPGTMGGGFADYIIGDRWVTPMAHQPYYSEKIVQLPDCYQPNDSRRAIAPDDPGRQACGLPPDGFVYCCFNQSYKLSRPVFRRWMNILRATPGSVLWLLENTPAATANLLREAQACAIAPERLVFAPRLPLDQHLARHRLADLFLDTLPCNAHTTASDALWAGLPVLTCTGEAFAGRVATSLLHAIGLPRLATASLDEYEDLAKALAARPDLLADIRRQLAENRLSHPLFDIARFTANLEKAYGEMWRRWCDGRAADSFVVD